MQVKRATLGGAMFTYFYARNRPDPSQRRDTQLCASTTRRFSLGCGVNWGEWFSVEIQFTWQPTEGSQIHKLLLFPVLYIKVILLS